MQISVEIAGKTCSLNIHFFEILRFDYGAVDKIGIVR